MPNIIVTGGQFGDEGKGRVVDLLVYRERPEWVVRFSGGENAGHTIQNNLGEFKLHHIPSGVFRQGTMSVLGCGMVINLGNLDREITKLQEKAIMVSSSNLKISLLAHLVMPWHLLLEAQEEEDRGVSQISTTGKGIGPCFSDRVGRRGIQIRDLDDHEGLREKLAFLHRYNSSRLRDNFKEDLPSPKEIFEELMDFTEKLQSHFANTEGMLQEAQQKDETILLEGAQGTLLDVDFGFYPPYVTSSHTTRWGAYVGSGVKAAPDDRVIGVFKAYVTRVGEGPFLTEADDEITKFLRERGREYGTTTGKPRRIGHFDLPMARYSHRINGFTELALTKCDVLDAQEEVKVAVAYETPGGSLSTPPIGFAGFSAWRPSYMNLPGWYTDTTGVRHIRDLPEAMRLFMRILEGEVGLPIKMISVGPKREETVLIE